MTGAPAFVRNGRMDILAANRLGHALYSEMFADPRRPANTARFVFLDPRAPGFYLDWEQVASDSVAILRSEAGRNPYDRDLSDLVGELSTQSELFRTRWAAHNVRYHDTGTQAVPSPGRRRPHADLRDHDARRRLGTDDVRLHRRGRLEVRGGAEPPRELDGDTRARRGDDRCRSRAAALTRGSGRRLVHRRGLRGRGRGAVGHLARDGEQRPLHAGRAHRVAHAPERPDDLRPRGRRPLRSAAAARSR